MENDCIVLCLTKLRKQIDATGLMDFCQSLQEL